MLKFLEKEEDRAKFYIHDDKSTKLFIIRRKKIS